MSNVTASFDNNSTNSNFASTTATAMAATETISTTTAGGGTTMTTTSQQQQQQQQQRLSKQASWMLASTSAAVTASSSSMSFHGDDEDQSICTLDSHLNALELEVKKMNRRADAIIESILHNEDKDPESNDKTSKTILEETSRVDVNSNIAKSASSQSSSKLLQSNSGTYDDDELTNEIQRLDDVTQDLRNSLDNSYSAHQILAQLELTASGHNEDEDALQMQMQPVDDHDDDDQDKEGGDKGDVDDDQDEDKTGNSSSNASDTVMLAAASPTTNPSSFAVPTATERRTAHFARSTKQSYRYPSQPEQHQATLTTTRSIPSHYDISTTLLPSMVSLSQSQIMQRHSKTVQVSWMVACTTVWMIVLMLLYHARYHLLDQGGQMQLPFYHSV